MPDEVTLGHESGTLGSRREVGPDELVAAALVRVAHDDDCVAARAQDACDLPEGATHRIEERAVVRRVRQVGCGVADHRVVGPPVGMGLGQLAAGHRQRELDVVGRIGRDQVDRGVRQGRQDLERVAGPHLQARRIEGPRRARVGRPEVGDRRTTAVMLGGETGDDVLVDRHPAWIELDADRPARAPGDGRPEQRAANTGEGIEHQLAAAGEELDQSCHQAWRLVRAVRLAGSVAELGRIGSRQHRLREVEPLLTR